MTRWGADFKETFKVREPKSGHSVLATLSCLRQGRGVGKMSTPLVVDLSFFLKVAVLTGRVLRGSFCGRDTPDPDIRDDYSSATRWRYQYRR